MKTTYAHLDYMQVAKDSHLAVRAFTHWLCGKEDLIEGFGAMEGEGDKYKKDPNLMKQVVGNSVTPAIIANDPRRLYEFFDDQNIRISICEHPDSTDDVPLFTYHNSVIKNAKTAASRHLAEENALYDAFIILQKRITHADSPKEDRAENKAQDS